MFHVYPLHYTMVHLFSLSLDMQIIRENTSGIAIVDPYYMRDGFLGSPAERRIVASYLKRILVAYKTKEYILVPYFPEEVVINSPPSIGFIRLSSFFFQHIPFDFFRRDEHSTLISLSLKHSHATYCHSGSLEKNKNYNKSKELLDDALTGYAS